MKGQFFVIASIIMVLIMVLIKTGTEIPRIVETKKYIEANFETKEFINFEEQLEKTMKYSYNKNEMENVKKYLRYAKESFGGRAKELKVLAIGAEYKNVVQGANTLNVEILNLLTETIIQLNVSFSYDLTQNKTFSQIEENQSVITTFSFLYSTPTNYTLYISYSTASKTKNYSIRIPIEKGSKFVGYFDVRLIGEISDNQDEIREEINLA